MVWSKWVESIRQYVFGEHLAPELEAPFRLFSRVRTARATRSLAIFLFIFNLLAWPTDFIFLKDPILVALFIYLRVGLTFIFLSLIVLMSIEKVRTSSAAVPIISAFACLGSMLGGVVAGSWGGLETPFFYVIYTFSGVTMILFVSLIERILVTVAFTLSFVLPYFLLFPEHWQHPFVASNLVVASSANLAYVVIGQALYRLSRINFLQAAALEEANRKSETLLCNILPAPIAERLKEQQRPIADGFAHVTVLFADIANFTPLSASLTPERLVDLLNRVFSEFDVLADRHGLEKIKTIGDAYMVAGGIPEPRADHAQAVAEMALDMRQALERLGQELGQRLEVRIGINSGPVVAGVIGVRKFIYDLWGDTVNTASRMESAGIPGQIQVTEASAQALEPHFVLEPRGEIDVKGKGRMNTWLLKGRR